MKSFFLVPIFAFGLTLYGQNVNMSNGTTTTCSANFYDSGGPGGNYGNNESFSYTFYPATLGDMIEINFASYQTGGFDQIYIFDGPDNTYPLLFSGGGVITIPAQTSSDISGALTIEFFSNASGNQAGWVATIFCCSSPTFWYADNDGDGFGDMWNYAYSCAQPLGYVANSDDCDDASVLYEDLDFDGYGNPAITVGCGAYDNSDCDDSQFTYEDFDNDNFGNPNVVTPCGVADDTDCDDNDNGVGGGVMSTYYQDLDGDGFGSGWTIPVIACSQPVGYIDNQDDCDDGAFTYEDFDGDGFGNPLVMNGCGVYDNSDCSDLVITYADNDNDNFGDYNVLDPCGVIDNTDCDDNDAGVGGGTLTAFYFDNDGDGFGDSWNSIMACSAPTGYVNNNDDCDDWNILFQDLDGDGYGNPLVVVACGAWNDLDCDDTQITYADNDGDNFGNPNITDPCGLVDNTDCDDNDSGVGGGTITAYYEDFDGDGFGSPWFPLFACTQPIGYVTDSSDCDDWSITYPDVDGDGFGVFGAAVPCGAYNDLDCNDALLTYEDIDGDNFGNPNVLAPCGITDNTDCDDNDAGVGGGTITAYYSDWDGDLFGSSMWGVIYSCSPIVGYVADSTDCDDFNPDVNPGATEIPSNSIDDNCDGYIDPVASVSEIDEVLFNIYPNPAKGTVFIKASGINDESFQIKIYDLNGQQILLSQLAIYTGETVELDLSNLAAGVYFVNIYSSKQNSNHKLIVE